MNYLLSVSAEAEHPNFVNPPKGVCEARRSGPLLTFGAESQALETRSQMRAAPASVTERDPSLRRYARSTAPSGMTPVSR